VDKRIIIGGVAVLIIIGIFIFPKEKESVVEPTVKQDTTGALLYDQASSFKAGGDTVKARDTYQRILIEHPDFVEVEKV